MASGVAMEHFRFAILSNFARHRISIKEKNRSNAVLLVLWGNILTHLDGASVNSPFSATPCRHPVTNPEVRGMQSLRGSHIIFVNVVGAMLSPKAKTIWCSKKKEQRVPLFMTFIKLKSLSPVG
jgi:uncharacterized membrane protein YidH (DUF202 family)